MAKPDNEQVMKNRERALERMRGKYPDKNFDDDEAFFGQINDDYDDYDKQIGTYKEREKALSDMFASDPRSAAFLTNWRRGEDPVVQLIRQFGTEIVDAVDDPERQEAIAAANKEFVKKMAKEKELEDEYQKNLDESLSFLEQYQKDNGLSDEDIDATMAFLMGIVKDGLMGKFTPESIDMARKAITHDADVTNAGDEGEIRGRNAKIEERLKKREKGDGTAPLGGSNGGTGGGAPKRPMGALDKYGDDSQTIWERGGEKRVRFAD